MPLVVEKLSASVSGVHGRVWARSAQPVQRSSTVSPRRRTTSAPPPRPRVTSLANDSTARPNSGSAWPRTSGGSGSSAGKPVSLRDDGPRAAPALEPPADDPLGMDADERRRQRDRLPPPADLDPPRAPRLRAREVVDDDRRAARPGDVAELLGPLEL